MWLTLTLFWAHVFTWFLTEKLMLSIDLYLAMKDFLSHYGILQQVRHFSLSVINSKSLWMQCHSIQGYWKAMIEQLVLLFARTPASEQEWLEISTLFEKLWKCQNVLWAIDGKLITIIKPKDSGSFYYNYKHTQSIIPISIAGPEYQWLYVVTDVQSNIWVNDSECGKKDLY